MKRLNVFCDMHHDALFNFLRILFEERLGWRIFMPVGFDWYEKGYWKYSEKREVIEQYLRIYDYYVRNENEGFYYIPENRHNTVLKGITLEDFKRKNIDIVVGSVVQHEDSFTRLVKDLKPKAKFIRVIGNWGERINYDKSRNIMFTAKPEQEIPSDVNYVICHQEFSLGIFSYEEPKGEELLIQNFMNCLPDSIDYYLWNEYKRELTEFKFNMFGILGEQGIIGEVQEMAETMKKSTFIWHVKFGGDGFGHVIHNAFAVGRPLIVKASYYKGKLAEPLLEDMVTCVDLEKRKKEENIKVIREMAKPENHRRMCENVYKRFKEVVDFNKEFFEIKKFLERLK